MTRRGLTLIETVISVAVVSLLLAAALNTTGVASATRALANDRRLAEELCQSMMSEILAHPFVDPDDGKDDLAPTFAESAFASRLAFDDIGDYHAWSASPPVNRDASAIAGTAGLTRTVHISRYINASRTDLFQHAGQVKVVRVRVLRNSRVIYELSALRAPDWDARESNR